jgi:UDP-N-acetylmuramoyl-tripeptide--D-alanyl-D-alanine ligase
MINIKIKEAADILNAGLWGTYDWDKPIKGVSIDSRKVTENSLFIPIKGMTVNGHAFVKDAIEKGAAASLWNKDEPNPPEDIALILVEDTVKSLQDLSRYYRNKLNVKIVGVTGSNGKTSTKDITAAILSQKYKTQKTLGNYNTEIGVPYTLLSLDEDCQAAVIEMGMERKGEIEFLTDLVQPDIAIITSVGLVHIDNFPSIEEIAKAKLEIVKGIKDGGLFIYYGDDPLIEETVKNTEIKEGVRRQTFGLNKSNTIWLKEFRQDLEGITIRVSDESLDEIHIDILGKHQALNAMAAILAGRELGMKPEEIRSGLSRIEKTGLRNEVIKTFLPDKAALRATPKAAVVFPFPFPV